MSGASFALRKRLATGEPLIFPWMGTPGAQLAGQVARLGFPAVALDLQHSTIDMGEAAQMVAAINAVVCLPSCVCAGTIRASSNRRSTWALPPSSRP